jgi:tetratricopeptide (TPR) repeat protein
MAFCLLPQSIDKPAAWADALRDVLPSEGGGVPPEPAWPRVRLLIRDDAAAPVLIPALRRVKNPEVLILEPDLSPPALMDAMAREVADPGMPEPQRMQMLAELAALDYAYGRLQEAVAKYEILYDYYHRHQAPLMEAMVLQGVGDVLRRIGKLPLARERFGQGLTLAITTKGLPLIMSLAFSAGDTSLELQRFKDAEDHLEIARKVAGKLFNHPVEADALEKIGDARLAQKLPGEAMTAWRDAANVCRKAAYRERLVSVLEKMSKTFASARMSADQRACDSELAAVRAGAPIKAPVA